jgi:hypothetical protein
MLVPRLLVSAAPVTPPPPPTLSGVAFDVGFYPGDGGGFFAVEFVIDNPVGGEYIEITYDITAGAPIITLGAGGPAGPFTVSPAQVNVSLGAAPAPYGSTIPEAEATVNLYSSGAVLLDSVFLPDQPLPV